MTRKLDPKGFSGLATILVVLAITAVGIGGWFAWRKSHERQSIELSNDVNSVPRPSIHGDKNIYKTLNCNDVFEVTYPELLHTEINEHGHCLITNVDTEKLTDLRNPPPEQLFLFFSSRPTEYLTASQYLDFLIEQSQQDYGLDLKAQQKVNLDNGSEAILATVYGGHPVRRNFRVFIYLKGKVAIMATYEINSIHQDIILKILKTIR